MLKILHPLKKMAFRMLGCLLLRHHLRVTHRRSEDKTALKIATFCPSSDVTVDGYRRFWFGCNDVRATDVEGANGYPRGYDVRG